MTRANHHARCTLRTMKCPHNVRSQDALQELQRCIYKRITQSLYNRVVDKHIKPAELRIDHIKHVVDGLGNGDVCASLDNTNPVNVRKPLCFALHVLGVSAVKHNNRSLARKSFGYGKAGVSHGTGHQYCLVPEIMTTHQSPCPIPIDSVRGTDVSKVVSVMPQAHGLE